MKRKIQELEYSLTACICHPLRKIKFNTILHLYNSEELGSRSIPLHSAESVGTRRPFVDFFANIRDNLDVYKTI